MLTHKIINDVVEETFGSVKGVFNIKIPKGTKTNLIKLVMRVSQDGASRATISDFLNQLGDKISIIIGSKVIQSFDPIEYYEYVIRKMANLGYSGFAVPDDGTGQTGAITEFIFPIFLCPLDKESIENGFMHKDYGFDGGKKVSVIIEYPADANELNLRLLSAYSVSMDEGNPSKVIEYEQLNKTFSAIGTKQVISLAQDSSLKLFDLMIKEASSLSGGMVTYIPTISRISYQEDNLDKKFMDIRLSHLEVPFHISDSEDDGKRKFDDAYKILAFHENNNAETSMQLAKTSQMVVEVLVAERIDWTQIRISPLSLYN